MAVYEVNSSVVDNQAIIGPKEKRYFLALVRGHAAFGGLKVLKCSVQRNGFHLLVAIPRRPDVLPTDVELLSRVDAICKAREVKRVQSQLAEMRNANDHASVKALRETYFRRMWDLSHFVKALKQRFTQWYNTRNGRRGVLWSERFRSALLEQSERVAAISDPTRHASAWPWPGLLVTFTGHCTYHRQSRSRAITVADNQAHAGANSRGRDQTLSGAVA